MDRLVILGGLGAVSILVIGGARLAERDAAAGRPVELTQAPTMATTAQVPPGQTLPGFSGALQMAPDASAALTAMPSVVPAEPVVPPELHYLASAADNAPPILEPGAAAP